MSFPVPPPNGGSTDKNVNKMDPAPPEQDAERDSWSLRIAKVSGIPIRLHFTFLLLIIYLAVSGVGRGGAANVLFVLGVFFCVVLHELGHSLTAQRLGYPVRDITLYPIGGVASIESTPRARHELLIAVAGPAVNVVIAAVLALYIHFGRSGNVVEEVRSIFHTPSTFQGGYTTLLLYANLMLVVFNMIPAFPMDGGRVLRAALALRMPRERATLIAARIGQFCAILMGLAGFFTQQFLLLIIALFVFFGAGQELRAEEVQEAVAEIAEEVPISAAMMRKFTTLAHGDTLKQAADALLAGSQQDFPVLAGEEIVGILSRNALLRGLAREGEHGYIAGAMERELTFARPEDSLEPILLQGEALQRAPILVRNETGVLVGILTLENLMEYLTLQQIARRREAALERPPI